MFQKPAPDGQGTTDTCTGVVNILQKPVPYCLDAPSCQDVTNICTRLPWCYRHLNYIVKMLRTLSNYFREIRLQVERTRPSQNSSTDIQKLQLYCKQQKQKYNKFLTNLLTLILPPSVTATVSKVQLIVNTNPFTVLMHFFNFSNVIKF